jgi:L-arabinose isomerase
VLAPTMVGPPGYAAAAIEAAGAPVVVWMAPERSRLPPDLTPRQAAGHSQLVGAAMIGNVLVRRGAPFATVTTAPGDEVARRRLERVVRAAATAGRLRDSVALRIGETIDGYLDVYASAKELGRLGVREESLSVETLEDAFEATSAAAARALLAELATEGWELGDFPLLEHSARLAVAVTELIEQTDAACGTVNCHGPCFRQNAKIGVPACLAVSVSTGRGIPLSCTGDQPTAIALLLARRLSGAALYCELNSAEPETGLALLSAGGEGDPAWRAPGAGVRVEPNGFFVGSLGEGAGVSFDVAEGPATLLSLSPVGDDWRLAWATGEVVESRYRSLETPNAMFRFDRGPAPEAGEAWIRSGATHHAALAAGRLDVEVPVLAEALGIQIQRV